MRHLILALMIPVTLSASPKVNPKTVQGFESGTFIRKYPQADPKSTYSLRTGGTNNSYSFTDSENTNSWFGLDLTTKDNVVVEISIHWNGQSTSRPAKLTPQKIEHINELAAFWGIPNQAKAIVEYAKSQQGKRYSGGSNQAPRKTIGPISIHCGTTGETLWLGWK